MNHWGKPGDAPPSACPAGWHVRQRDVGSLGRTVRGAPSQSRAALARGPHAPRPRLPRGARCPQHSSSPSFSSLPTFGGTRFEGPFKHNNVQTPVVLNPGILPAANVRSFPSRFLTGTSSTLDPLAAVPVWGGPCSSAHPLPEHSPAHSEAGSAHSSSTTTRASHCHGVQTRAGLESKDFLICPHLTSMGSISPHS